MERLFCARGRIRTLNPQSRNLVFYPVELRMHLFLQSYEINSATLEAASLSTIAE